MCKRSFFTFPNQKVDNKCSDTFTFIVKIFFKEPKLLIKKAGKYFGPRKILT